VAVALLVVPLAELWVVLQVGQLIGGWPTVLLLLAESLLGAVILRHEGPAAWRRLQAALRQGRMPSDELTDAALVLVGGTLLLTPGFLTDVVGFICVLPPTRPLARRLLRRFLRRRVRVAAFGFGGRTWGTGSSGTGWAGPGNVVQGEVVDDSRDDPPRP
jgi:UPF0716 protein FxsA